MIPYRSHTKNKPRFFPKRLYRGRARIEQAIGKPKRFKRIAMRCEKTAESFAAFVAFACGLTLVKSVHRAWQARRVARLCMTRPSGVRGSWMRRLSPGREGGIRWCAEDILISLGLYLIEIKFPRKYVMGFRIPDGRSCRRQVLEKLKVPLKPTGAEQHYKKGRGLQAPMIPRVRLRNSRFSRERRCGATELTFEQ